MRKRLISFALSIVCVFGLVYSCFEVFAENTTPNLTSAGYTASINPFVSSGYGGQCTAFVYGRVYEKLGIKLTAKKYTSNGTDGLTKGTTYTSFRNDAKTWWYVNKALGIYEYGSTPRANSIVVWTGGGYGHVGFVEKVSGSTVYFNEANFNNYVNSNYGGGWDKTLHSLSSTAIKKRGSYTLLGYIYLEEEKEETPITLTFSYNANGGTGSMPSTTIAYNGSLVISQNEFENEGHAFVEWNVKRNNDNTWYVSGKGWFSEEDIIANGYTKRAYSGGSEYKLDNSWTNGITGDASYTFYAVWCDSTIASIHINSIGNKHFYYVGDQLETYDIALMVKKTDGSCSIVTDGFICTPSMLSKEGIQTITVEYEGFTTSFDVIVTDSKSRTINATAKSASVGYLLPSTSSETIANQGSYANDSLQVLCKDGNFYLCFVPWGSTKVNATNGVLMYLPTNTVTLSSSVPDAKDYYTLNSTGEINAIINRTTYMYHRPDGGSTDLTYYDVSYKSVGPLEEGTPIKVLFEMNGYYCVQTDKYTGFVSTYEVTFLPFMTSIYVDYPVTQMSVNVGEMVTKDSFDVAAVYSDGSSEHLDTFELLSPDTSTTGTRYAIVSYQGFYNYIEVCVEDSVSNIMGDVDGNGNIDQFDYLYVKRAYFKTYTLSEDEAYRADVNYDDVVDQYDYLIIKRIYFDTYTVK